MILIVSFADNPHVERVRRHLKSETAVVDIGWFPSAMKLDARFDDDFEGLRLILPSGNTVTAANVGAVWNRRIKPLTLHSELTDETSKLFAWSESNEALLGFWYSLRCFWMNPLTSDEVSQRKIRQLQVARSVGLTVPETVITNDPVIARDFILLKEPRKVIRKAFRNIQQAPRETKIVTKEDLAIIASVRFAPVIFQEFIPAERDLRITVVDEEIFTAGIYSEPAFQTDYRSGLPSARVVSEELPDTIASKLLKLMQELNVSFGAIDMRVTPEGEYVFLEINPAGEYLFIVDRTGQKIPEAIAATLERRNAAHHKQAE